MVAFATLAASTSRPVSLTKVETRVRVFSVTRRSRSDSRQLLTHSLTESVSVSTDLTDVILVSDDTY